MAATTAQTMIDEAINLCPPRDTEEDAREKQQLLQNVLKAEQEVRDAEAALDAKALRSSITMTLERENAFKDRQHDLQMQHQYMQEYLRFMSRRSADHDLEAVIKAHRASLLHLLRQRVNVSQHDKLVTQHEQRQDFARSARGKELQRRYAQLTSELARAENLGEGALILGAKNALERVRSEFDTAAQRHVIPR